MPRLPDLDSLGRRPAPQSNRGIARQDTTAAGEALAGFGQTIGREGGKLVDEWNRRNDEQAVFEARRALNDWEREKVFDPEAGAIARRGKDAFDLPKTLPADFDKFTSEVGAKLGNNRQRLAFQEMAQSRRMQLGAWADGHALKQREVFNEGQYQADLAAFADRAVLYADDPAKVATELAIQNQRTIGHLRGKGQSEEFIAAAVKENASRVHTSVVAAMVNNGNAAGAQEYLTKNAASMNADDVQRVRSSLKEGLAREKSQTFADEMGDRPLAESLAEARKRFTGTEEAAAISEVKTRAAEREAIKAQGFKDNADSAWKVITNGGGKNQIPPTVWNALGGEEQRQINDYVEAKWRRAKADAEGKHKTDMDVWIGLSEMAQNDPAAFALQDPRKWQPYLTDADLQGLVRLQGRLSAGDAKAMQEQATIKRTVALVKTEIQAAGIDLNPGDNKAKIKRNNEFFGALSQALNAATEAKGGPLDEKEAKIIGMNMLREGIEQGSGIFGIGQSKKRGYQIVAEGDPTKSYVSKRYSDIPPDIRAALEAELPRESGIYGNASARAEKVERMYQRGVELGRFK